MTLLVGATVASPAIRGDHGGFHAGNEYDPVKQPLKYVQTVVFCGPSTMDDGPVPDCPQESPENCDESPFCGENGTDVTVGYVGDIGWCETHEDDWRGRANAAFQETADAFADTEVTLTFAWKACVFLDDPLGTYDHDAGRYIHSHDGDSHPYWFNKVPANHRVDSCLGPKDDDNDMSYFNAQQGLYHTHSDGSQHWHPASDQSGLVDYNGFTGLFAARYDLEQLHGASPHADMVQLLHDNQFNNGDTFGRACLPSAPQVEGEEGSVTLEPSPHTAATGEQVTPTHEMGHTFNTYHCDSRPAGAAQYTIMASHDAGQCPENTGFQHAFWFSDRAKGVIEEYATSTYG